MTVQERELDLEAVEAFAGRLAGAYAESMTTAMVALGHKVGLFEAAAEGPATSAELATRAGLVERYVREWLGAVTTAGSSPTTPVPRRTRCPTSTGPCSPVTVPATWRRTRCS